MEIIIIRSNVNIDKLAFIFSVKLKNNEVVSTSGICESLPPLRILSSYKTVNFAQLS